MIYAIRSRDVAKIPYSIIVGSFCLRFSLTLNHVSIRLTHVATVALTCGPELRWEVVAQGETANLPEVSSKAAEVKRAAFPGIVSHGLDPLPSKRLC